jgi:hypothetical protein
MGHTYKAVFEACLLEFFCNDNQLETVKGGETLLKANARPNFSVPHASSSCVVVV